MNAEILNIVNQIESEAFWLLLKLIGVGIVLLVIKGFIEKVVAYLFFRWDKDLSVGVRIFVRGQEGVIESFNLSCIHIRTHDRIIIVRMRRLIFEKIDLVRRDVKDDKDDKN